MTSAVVRWGILGTGRAARNLSAAIGAEAGGRLQAVAGRGSYEALAASGEIDVVHIATPHTKHYEHAVLCLEAGKHVVCEKPMTLSGKQAAEMAALADRNGLFLMEAVWTRFLPAAIRCLELARDGSLGALQFVDTSIALRFDPATDLRVFDPTLGGGALNELATYPLAFGVAFLGPVLAAKASGTRSGPVVAQCVVQCTHARGLSSGFCALDFQGRNHVRVAGSEGQATLLPAAGRFETIALWNRATGKETLEQHVYPGTGYEFMVRHVNQCIREGRGESPMMTRAESINIAEAIEQCNLQLG